MLPEENESDIDYMRRGLRRASVKMMHSQGYDMVERPLLRNDETIPIAADMCVAVHPGFPTKTNFVFICDNFLIHRDGSVEHMHKTEQKIYEVDGAAVRELPHAPVALRHFEDDLPDAQAVADEQQRPSVPENIKRTRNRARRPARCRPGSGHRFLFFHGKIMPH